MNFYYPGQDPYYYSPTSYIIFPAYPPAFPVQNIENSEKSQLKPEGQIEKEKSPIENLNQLEKKRVSRKKKRRRDYQENQYGMKIQKVDRNSFSNSLKIFLKYLRDLKHTNPQLVESIIYKHSLNYSLPRFYEDFQKLLPQKTTYFGYSSTQLLVEGYPKIKSFSIVFRILMKSFYLKQVFGTVLTSKKIVGKAKRIQISEGRNVYRKLIDQKEAQK